MPKSTVSHRVKKTIDGDRSYIQTYHDDGTLDFLLFIHGILGDHHETWRDTPAQLMTEQALAAADFGSFGYHTTLFDSHTTRSQALQLNMWMRTHLYRYPRIFVIAHSMGGLITREACALLARSQHKDDHDLLCRIKHCFFVAVPIAGSSTASWLRKVPLVSWLNRKVEILANPSVEGRQLRDFYEESMQQYGAAPRPTYSLFTGSRDGLVDTPPEWVLSRDDRYEGVVEGTHGSIKTDQSANSTLLRRIVQIIEGHQTPPSQTPPYRAAAPSAKAGSPCDVMIVACSASKSTVGERVHNYAASLPDRLANDNLRDAVHAMRSMIKGLIESGRLAGGEFREGNRRSRYQNRKLLFGPDFGGLDNEAVYLPAYKRYSGRCFQVTEREWEQFYALPEHGRPALLVVSGLYGLCRAEDEIQNYDCHMSDLDGESGWSLARHWQGYLTDMIVSHLRWRENTGLPVRRVLNLLVEDVYGEVIDWQRIGGSWQVLHQSFEKSHGREALDNVGVWLQKAIVQPLTLAQLRANVYVDDPRFLDGDRMMFQATKAPRGTHA